MWTEVFEPLLFNRVTIDNIVVNLDVILEFLVCRVPGLILVCSEIFAVGEAIKGMLIKITNNTKLEGTGCMMDNNSNSKDFHLEPWLWC